MRLLIHPKPSPNKNHMRTKKFPTAGNIKNIMPKIAAALLMLGDLKINDIITRPVMITSWDCSLLALSFIIKIRCI